MTDQSFAQLVDAANDVLAHPRREATFAGENGALQAAPRFEVYHSAPSLCSFKVRAVLFERGISFRSHDMNIMPIRGSTPENYRPEYVRMRLRGAPNARLVDGYTGASAVATEGFDPCVVPTLVDREKQAVVVDSARICEYLDRECTQGESLVPKAMADAVRTQIDRVDRAPHVAALYGAHPDGDHRPGGLRTNIKDVHGKKIAAVEAMMAAAGNDAELQTAYRAKIVKESSADKFVYDRDSMRRAHRAMDEHVGELEAQLESCGGPWVLGDAYTLADIMWTNSIYRLKWLGMGRFWEEDASRPRVREYAERAFARPSFRRAVVNWPGAYGPSPHVKDFRGPLALLRFIWQMQRRQPI